MLRLADRIYTVVLATCALLLAGVTVLVTFQVLGRYVPWFPRSLWTEEVSRIFFVWFVFIGAAAAVRRGDHFVVDVIPERLTRVRRPLELVVLGVLGLVSVVLLVGGLAFVQVGVNRTSATSGINMAWAFSAMPIAGALMVFFVLEHLLRIIRNLPTEVDKAGEGVEL